MKSLIERSRAAFDSLSSREQMMVLLTFGAVLVMVLGIGSYLIKRDLAARERRIEVKIEKLEEAASLRSDYQRRLREQERIASQVKRNNQVRLLSYLERLSQQSNVTLKNASERPGGSTGSALVKEEAAEVKISNVSLDRLHDFLKRIEEGNPLIKVRRLRIKTRFDNPEMLDAVITVGTYKTTGS